MPSTDRVLSRSVFDHALHDDPLDPGTILAGHPTTALAELADLADPAFTSVGLWEITEGTVTDVEADEIFVVLSGRCTLTVEGDGSWQLEPGMVVRLHAGERTVWEVHERLRKIYLA